MNKLCFVRSIVYHILLKKEIEFCEIKTITETKKLSQFSQARICFPNDQWEHARYKKEPYFFICDKRQNNNVKRNQIKSLKE